jgi:hypothetical protein
VADSAGSGTSSPELANCQGRVEELVVFHHGDPIDEAEVASRLLGVFERIRVPVCRVVWWGCDAEVPLEVGRDGWTDLFMRRLGGIVRCEPCDREAPIELV